MRFSAILLAAVVVSRAALALPGDCTLKKSLKVSIGGKWETFSAGTVLTVTDGGPQWTQVTTPKGTGRASSKLLEGACALPPLAEETQETGNPAEKKAEEPAGKKAEKKAENEPATTAAPSLVDVAVAAVPTAAGAAAVEAAAPAPGPAAATAAPAVPAAAAPVAEAAAPVAAAAAVAVTAATASAPEALASAPAVDAPVLATAALPAVDVAASPAVPAVPSSPAVPAVPAPPAEERTLVAVLDLKASPGAEAAAQALSTMLTAEVSGLDGYRAVSRNELRAILAHSADAQLAGCAEIQCMADVAKLVSAGIILSGEVSKLEGATALSLTLVDTRDGEPRIVARQEAAWRGSDDDLLLLARPLAQRLFDAPNAAQHTGTIELFATEGATVFVDGRELGVTPLSGPLSDVPTGAHRIELKKDGFVPQAIDVVVARNETTLARAELQPIPLTDAPWFWFAAGGVVLLAGGAAAGITTWATVDAANKQPARVVLGKAP